MSGKSMSSSSMAAVSDTALLEITLELFRGSHAQVILSGCVNLFVMYTLYHTILQPVDGGASEAWKDPNKYMLAHLVLMFELLCMCMAICMISFALRGILWQQAWKRWLPTSEYASDRGIGLPFLWLGVGCFALTLYIHYAYSHLLPWRNSIVFLLAAGCSVLSFLITYKNREQAMTIARVRAPEAAHTE